ncbi:MAG: right-handed parallel beta-helix repeat-containing protein, partial [Chloroflexi bacterium]|nr:right-handed parallel beta-helix repeat-containing protein [Chloroflexota bacterium]
LYYGGHYTFTNVTIQNNAGDGIYAQYIGDLTLTNSTLTNNAGYGYFDNNSNNSLALQNVNLTNNGVAGRLSVNTAMNNVDWTGNGRNEIEWSGGTLQQDAAWNRLPAGITTYHVVGDITVADGVSLTVGAGVNVIFSQYTGLFVNGQITAVGTPTDSITFTAAVSNTSGYWDFVQIGGGSVLTDSDSSQISYALLEGGGYSTYNPTLYIYRSSPTLDHITIRNSGGEGLYAYYYYNDQKGFSLDTAVIENNGEQGMYLYYGGHYTFTNVTIQNNAGDGIYAQY